MEWKHEYVLKVNNVEVPSRYYGICLKNPNLRRNRQLPLSIPYKHETCNNV